MRIELTHIEEHEDGSATLAADLDQEGLRFLVNLGLVTAVEEAMKQHKELEPYEPESGDEVSGC